MYLLLVTSLSTNSRIVCLLHFQVEKIIKKKKYRINSASFCTSTHIHIFSDLKIATLINSPRTCMLSTITCWWQHTLMPAYLSGRQIVAAEKHKYVSCNINKPDWLDLRLTWRWKCFSALTLTYFAGIFRFICICICFVLTYCCGAVAGASPTNHSTYIQQSHILSAPFTHTLHSFVCLVKWSLDLGTQVPPVPHAQNSTCCFCFVFSLSCVGRKGDLFVWNAKLP